MSDEYRRVEVITGTARRRYWSASEKLRVVEESLAPSASVSEVARRNGVAPNLLFRWRRLMWDYPGVNTLKPDRLDELAMHPTVKPVALVLARSRIVRSGATWFWTPSAAAARR